MKFSFLIVTDPKNDWIYKKIPAIQKLMKLSPDIEDVSFDVQFKSGLMPQVVNGRITSQWFQENITMKNTLEGYLGAIYLVSDDDGKMLDLEDGVRGTYLRDGDEFMECWVRGNENQVTEFFDGTRRDRVTKVIPHEFGHGFHEFGYTSLQIHDYDYKNSINNIEGFYEAFRIAKSKTEKQTLIIFTLKRIIRLLTAMKQGEYDMILPIPEKYWNNPSQEYGVLNSRYPKTGRHIGTDFPTPIATPIKARMNGRVSVAGTGTDAGNYCYFTYVRNGNKYTDRYLHLHKVPKVGEYKQGEVFALSGMTGDSDGPHVHLETWYGDVDLLSINSSNWNLLTTDPRKVK